MAKSGDFLVMKQSSQRTLGLVPICSYKYSFDADSFSCLPCERGLKSYGLQEDECISCMRAWLKGGNSEFREAQYHQFCRDGYVFSIVEFALVPSFAFAIAFICCCVSPANGIKGNKMVCQEDEDVKADRERKMNSSTERKLMIRRVTSRNFSSPGNSMIKKTAKPPMSSRTETEMAMVGTDAPTARANDDDAGDVQMIVTAPETNGVPLQRRQDEDDPDVYSDTD